MLEELDHKIIANIVNRRLAESIRDCREISIELCLIIQKIVEEDREMLNQLRKVKPNFAYRTEVTEIDCLSTKCEEKALALRYALEKLDTQENIKEYTDTSPLLVLISILLKHNADVTFADSLGTTSLHIVVKKAMYHSKLVAQLIEKGAPVDAQDEKGYTPLYFAIQSNNIAAIDLLIQHGADLEKKDQYYERTVMGNALHHHAMNNNLQQKTIEHLLKNYSFKLNAQDEQGNTLMHLVAECISFDNMDYPEFFIGCFHYYYLKVDDKSDFWSLILSILEKDTTCHQPNKKGDTPLHVALENKNKTSPIIKFFIKQGAHLNSMNYRKQTPLLIALETLCFFEQHSSTTSIHENIETLLQFSPDVTLKDKEGDTAIQWIARLETLPNRLKGQIIYLDNPALSMLLLAEAREKCSNERINYLHLPLELKMIIIDSFFTSVYPNLGGKVIQWLKAYHLHLKDCKAKEKESCVETKFKLSF